MGSTNMHIETELKQCVTKLKKSNKQEEIIVS
jgi:hypothetical protein